MPGISAVGAESAAELLQQALLCGPFDKIESLLNILKADREELLVLMVKQTVVEADGSVVLPPLFRDDRGETTPYSEFSFWHTLSLLDEHPFWFYRVEHICFKGVPREEPFRLPPRLSRIPALRKLSLEECGLSAVPADVLLLRKLRYLNLRGNRLKTLPCGIGRLRQLVYFSAAENDLETLPEQLCCLRKLKVLDLSGNCLKSLGFSIDSLQNLNTLDLSGNFLDTVPAGLQSLTQLEKVDLAFNDLSARDEAAWESGYCNLIRNYQWHLAFN